MGYLETARSMGMTMAENLEGASFPTPTLRNGKKAPCVCRELILNGTRTVVPCGLHKYLKIRFK